MLSSRREEQKRPFRRSASAADCGPETQSIFGRGLLFFLCASVFNPSGTERRGAGEKAEGGKQG